ncbi:MAG: hypothetical protein FH748_05915 [Balneolaceae bacterium]|nr:hypothetical protein [Balneolaceae bacterium]
MKLIKDILGNRLVQTLLFWAVSFLVLLRLFSRTGDIRMLDVIYTILFHIPMIFAVTIHAYYQIPALLSKGKYITYSLSVIALLVFTPLVYSFTFSILSDYIFPGYYFVEFYSWFEIVAFTAIYLLATSLLEFSKSWFSEQKAKARLAELEAEHKTSELKALRAQINPHFLFNSLNTIYAEAVKKSEKTPALILNLSEMLRYTVDKMEQDKVLLSEELEYLENYIQLQKERLNYPAKVNYMVNGLVEEQEIAPLLLINFVENCFKHSDLSSEDGKVNINIKVDKKKLDMRCENTPKKEDDQIEISSGQGIQNAKRRLQLVYPDSHALHIKKDPNLYAVELTLTLDV